MCSRLANIYLLNNDIKSYNNYKFLVNNADLLEIKEIDTNN